jgi:hypothetical protein
MIEAVADRVRNGMGKDAAAIDAGISVATLHNWLGRGRAGEAPYDEFLRRVEAASASLKREIGKVLLKGLRSRNLMVATQNARWLAERLDPDTYGRRQEITGKDGGPVRVEAQVAVQPLFSDQAVAAATPEQLEAMARGVDTLLGQPPKSSSSV